MADPYEGLASTFIGSLPGPGFVPGLIAQHAKYVAGNAAAAGDYGAGADALGAAGLLDVQQAFRGLQTERTALTSYNAGDYASARAAAASGGDVKLYGDLGDQNAKDTADRASFLSNAADALLQIKDPAQRHDAFTAHIAPTLKAMGVPDNYIGQIGSADLSDQGLESFKTAVGHASAGKLMTAGDGSIVSIDPRTNKAVTVYDGAKPVVVGKSLVDPRTGQPIYQEPDYLKLSEGEKAIPLGGSPSAPASSPVASPGARGLRNNNPLNLTNLPNGQWDGQTGTDGRFAKFATLDDGLKAADHNLQSYAKNHGINTISGIINRWAPPSDGNNSSAYAATVARDVGVDPNAPLDLSKAENRQAILHAMAKVEVGGSIPTASGTNDKGDPAGTLYGNPKADPNGGAPSLTPAAITQGARVYAITGKLPTLPRGASSNADRSAIMNEAATLGGPDILEAKSTYDSLNRSMSEAVSRKTAIIPAARKALDTLDEAISFAEKNGVTIQGGLASPFAPALAFAKDHGHDANYTQFKNLLETAANEGAVAISGAKSGTSTDAARRELQGRVNTGMTIDQLKAARRAAAIEFDKSLRGSQAAIDDTRLQIHGILGVAPVKPLPAPPPAPPSNPGRVIHYDTQGNRVGG